MSTHPASEDASNKKAAIHKAARLKLQEMVEAKTGVRSNLDDKAVEGASSPSPSQIIDAVKRMEKCLADAGIPPTDFIHPPIMEMARVADELSRLSGVVLQRSDILNESLKSRADDEAERVVEYIRDTEQQILARLASAVDSASGDAVRAAQWRIGALMGCVLCAVALVGAGAGWWIGWTSGQERVSSIKSQLEDAFRNGPDGAAAWAVLMRGNDPKAALSECRGRMVWEDRGRKACYVRLWIDGWRPP